MGGARKTDREDEEKIDYSAESADIRKRNIGAWRGSQRDVGKRINDMTEGRGDTGQERREK